MKDEDFEDVTDGDEHGVCVNNNYDARDVLIDQRIERIDLINSAPFLFPPQKVPALRFFRVFRRG